MNPKALLEPHEAAIAEIREILFPEGQRMGSPMGCLAEEVQDILEKYGLEDVRAFAKEPVGRVNPNRKDGD